MKYKEYDAIIAETKILDDEDKSLDDIQKKLSELISDDLDNDIKRLLMWGGGEHFPAAPSESVGETVYTVDADGEVGCL